MELFNENTRDFLSGVVIPVNKPEGWTSFDVVNKIRTLLRFHKGYKKIKVGHAGTLDPVATGVLIVCTGKATKEISQLQAGNKTYDVCMKLGETTPSFDNETEVDKHYPFQHITETQLKTTIQNFIGEIEQVPPIYSAIHVDGKRAYEMAREGENPKLKARKIIIDDICLKTFDLPFVNFTVHCHTGTYIRSLVRDIGEALDSGAWMCNLVRTESGKFNIENSFSIKKIEEIIKK